MNAIKKGFSIVVWVVFVLIMALTLLLVGSKLLGMHVFTVLSGSMEPEYPTGSLIIVKPVPVETLQERDVITYLISDNTVVTHRITGVVPDETDPTVIRFRTKGDANNTEDLMLVHQNNVIGSPVLKIPYVGYVTNFIQKPPGTYIAIAVACVAMIIMYLPDLFAKEEPPKEDQPEEQLQ